METSHLTRELLFLSSASIAVVALAAILAALTGRPLAPEALGAGFGLALLLATLVGLLLALDARSRRQRLEPVLLPVADALGLCGMAGTVLAAGGVAGVIGGVEVFIEDTPDRGIRVRTRGPATELAVTTPVEGLEPGRLRALVEQLVRMHRAIG